MALSEKLLSDLLQAQNPDGGWGYAPGKLSRIEPTCWIVIALLASHSGHDEEIKNAIAWLTFQQFPDGSFRAGQAAEFSRWQTAVAALALHHAKADPMIRDRAIAALLEEQARQVHRPGHEIPGAQLAGWGWTNNAFAWVEPTAYSLIALSSVPIPESSRSRYEFRRTQAEELLWLRRCQDGGWNYGNAGASDYALGSFPMPTALALCALKPKESDQRFLSAWKCLATILAREPSLVALSWAIITAKTLHVDMPDWEHQLDAHLDLLPSQANFGKGLALLALGQPAKFLGGAE